jgi:hypothetical protein
MESKILSSVGKIAGVGGIALGVFLLIFRGVLEKQFLPQAGLQSEQAFAVILSLMILTFGIAGIGLIAWLIGRTAGPKIPASMTALGLLAGLIVVVLVASVYVSVQGKSGPNAVVPTTSVKASDGAFAAGGDVKNSTITITPSAVKPEK